MYPQTLCPNCRGGNAPDAPACHWCGYSLATPPQPVSYGKAGFLGVLGGLSAVVVFGIIVTVLFLAACFVCFSVFVMNAAAR